MTYQYLTVGMVRTAKENGEFIDQKKFKTAGKYGFDSLILTNASMQVLDSYIRYREIVKTQSLNQLTSKEQRILLEYQKLSSAVARVLYQKQRSREVAAKAHECLPKLQGTRGSEVDREVNMRV